ncbi:MAG: glycosyltransferase [Bacteroidaceae bacterium]|nr:glycosyltransferase [Bacteroidaceae bacterium]
MASLELGKYAKIIGGIPKTSNYEGEISQTSHIDLATIVRNIKRLLVKIGIDISPMVFKRIAKSLNKNCYDVVVAYQEGQPTALASYIEAGFHIAWQHSEYSRFIKLVNPNVYKKCLRKYDRIVNVSQTACSDFASSAPEFTDKLRVVYNSLNKECVAEKSAESIEQLGATINIVSVGRIDPVKRFSAIPSICRMLLDKDIKLDWWVIGGIADSEEYTRLESEIAKFGVESCVHILGKKQNPYPYIKASDLLVCLSSSETFNYTIAEAKALGIPVVTTDFPCAKEFVNDGINGLVCDIDHIGEGIYKMLTDEVLYNRIKDQMVKEGTMEETVRAQFAELLNSAS